MSCVRALVRDPAAVHDLNDLEERNLSDVGTVTLAMPFLRGASGLCY